MADLYPLAQQLGQAMLSRGWVLATAESCTGGGIGAAITAVPGSSAWFDGGVISYAWPDGRFVHTIGDVDGFARKLAQLGLP